MVETALEFDANPKTKLLAKYEDSPGFVNSNGWSNLRASPPIGTNGHVNGVPAGAKTGSRQDPHPLRPAPACKP